MVGHSWLTHTHAHTCTHTRPHTHTHTHTHTQQKEAEFFQKIFRELRVEPEYFMVGYYGKGFPLFLRVCLENISEFNSF